VMPQALRISSEMLMFDLLGSSPGFSSALGAGGGGGVGAALAVGAAGAGGGSEAQPAAMAVEKRTIAAAYFMTSSFKHAPSLGRDLVYLDCRYSRAEERSQHVRSQQGKWALYSDVGGLFESRWKNSVVTKR